MPTPANASNSYKQQITSIATNNIAISASKALAFTSASYTNTTLPTNSGAIRLYSPVDVYFNFDSGTDVYLAAGTEVFGIPAGVSSIYAKGVTTSGSLNISGLAEDCQYQITTSTSRTVTATTANVALPSGTYVRLFAMTDTLIAFGGSGVEADSNSTFFAAGTEIMKVPAGATYIAAIRDSEDGGLYITGLS